MLSAVARCRTGQLGHVIFECQSCGHPHWVGRSCGNRHGPTCQHQKTQQWLQKQTDRLLPGQQFVGVFLQHVLPKGFRKVRHFGWMASSSQTTRDRVKWLVWLWLGWVFWLASGVAPQPERVPVPFPECSRCGGALRLLAITDPTGRVVAGSPPVPPPVLASHATEYLDSG